MENLAPAPPLQLKTDRPYFSGQEYVFDLGCTLFKSGNFQGCVKYLRQAAKQFVRGKNFSFYMECYSMLFGALNELGEEELLKEVREEFEDNCRRYNLQKTPHVLAINGFYFGILKKNDSKASFYLNEALNVALKNQQDCIKRQDSPGELKSKLDIIRCLSCFCNYYFSRWEHDKCREQINHFNSLFDYVLNLKRELKDKKSYTDNVQLQKYYQSLLDVIEKEYLSLTRHNLSVKITSALLEIDPKKTKTILWESYEKANALNEQYLIPYILVYMAFNYFSLKEKEQAHLFLNLAKKSAEAQSFKILLKRIADLEKEFSKEKGGLYDLDPGLKESYDIVFNKEEHSFVGKTRGCVQFKNQFILLELLNLFIENQGQSYSKEELVKRIWREDYSPKVHDNKIYVTIKRLRDSIEPADGKSRYIFRNRNGYYLTEKVKVLVK